MAASLGLRAQGQNVQLDSAASTPKLKAKQQISKALSFRNQVIEAMMWTLVRRSIGPDTESGCKLCKQSEGTQQHHIHAHPLQQGPKRFELSAGAEASCSDSRKWANLQSQKQATSMDELGSYLHGFIHPRLPSLQLESNLDSITVTRQLHGIYGVSTFTCLYTSVQNISDHPAKLIGYDGKPTSELVRTPDSGVSKGSSSLRGKIIKLSLTQPQTCLSCSELFHMLSCFVRLMTK